MSDTPKLVSIGDVRLEADLYPRDSHDDATVSRYRDAIDRLPPIVITAEGWLVDGYHRYLAHIGEGLQEIEALVLDIPREQVLLESVRRNATHGKQLERKEKKRLARELFNQVERRELAELLAVSGQSILNWTVDMRREEDQKRVERMWQAWLGCAGVKEIAERESASDTTVTSAISKKLELAEVAPSSLQLYDVWNFAKPAEEYGNANYPGRVPGQILENLLWYYTEPGDVVIDPMAGGGTTIDVCKAMGRRYLAYDLRPSRPDIREHDSRNPLPIPPAIKHDASARVSLVFFDPPYWKQKRGEYAEGGLADDDLATFYASLQAALNNARAVLSDGGVFAVLIGPTQEKRKITDHAVDIMKMADAPLLRRFIVPYNTQQHGGNFVNIARENRYPLYLYRDLMVFGR